ncbi:hypothetical protein CFP56_031702 [Quercus suber]|uniref:Uncharacterized protein n=1 Tax=Quercus suber TaxID=58331 RepID=A0AAW0JJY3_QUESU
MSWLFKSFQSDGPDSSEQDNDDHSPSTTPHGVKDDLSALSQTLGRQFPASPTSWPRHHLLQSQPLIHHHHQNHSRNRNLKLSLEFATILLKLMGA